uniref:Uncharacterized protein n=1 Tax=Rhizophora mucronata TaxID=61149 RepID=A0A2P2PL78_RHIMU
MLYSVHGKQRNDRCPLEFPRMKGLKMNKWENHARYLCLR